MAYWNQGVQQNEEDWRELFDEDISLVPIYQPPSAVDSNGSLGYPTMSIDDPKPASTKAKTDADADIEMFRKESAGRHSFVDINLNDSDEPKLEPETERPNTLSIASFKPIRTIGRGTFGRVYLAKNIHNDKIYALKVIKKKALKANFGLIVSEQEVMKKLAESENDFLLPLEASFHDTKNFYLVTPFMHGGDLHRALFHRGTGLLSEEAARLCLAELVVATEAMHKKKILHRDLKLENIFIDKEGHLKIADFGLAAQLDAYDSDCDSNSPTSSQDSTEAPKEATKGFCGTPSYIAPEIYQGVSYSYSVDLWALGVIFYVIKVGSFPFDSDDDEMLRMATLHSDPFIPEGPNMNPDASDLMCQLLTKRPEHRITIDGIKRHPFFRNFSWCRVYNRSLDLGLTPPPSCHDESAIAAVSVDKIHKGWPYRSEAADLFPGFTWIPAGMLQPARANSLFSDSPSCSLTQSPLSADTRPISRVPNSPVILPHRELTPFTSPHLLRSPNRLPRSKKAPKAQLKLVIPPVTQGSLEFEEEENGRLSQISFGPISYKSGADDLDTQPHATPSSLAKEESERTRLFIRLPPRPRVAGVDHAELQPVKHTRTTDKKFQSVESEKSRGKLFIRVPPRQPVVPQLERLPTPSLPDHGISVPYAASQSHGRDIVPARKIKPLPQRVQRARPTSSNTPKLKIRLPPNPFNIRSSWRESSFGLEFIQSPALIHDDLVTPSTSELPTPFTSTIGSSRTPTYKLKSSSWIIKAPETEAGTEGQVGVGKKRRGSRLMFWARSARAKVYHVANYTKHAFGGDWREEVVEVQ